METIGQRIAELRKNANLTKVALGKAIGVSDVTVGYWERDLTEPSWKPLKQLAQHFGVTEEYLLYGIESGNVIPANLVNVGLRRIPIIPWADLNRVKDGYSAAYLDNTYETISVDDAYSHKAFAVRVRGDFMEGDASKTIPDSSIAIIEPSFDKNDLHGKVVLALLGEDATPTIKEYQTDGLTTYLAPWNKRYKVIEIKEQLDVIGCVKSVIIQLY